ncbi:nonribosomal peptide synthetase DhbF [Thermoflexales bacterium]|nr:nonribosomal peptide synthetase DhbF [Thermoflexales bacterium]
MTENNAPTTTLTPQEQRARLLHLLAKKESGIKLVPLSFSQERFWLEEQINPGGINGLNLSIRITGQLNVTALEQSFSEIVRRHEVLRTTFVVINDQPRQSIKPAQPVSLPVIPLEHFQVDERETEARRVVRAELNRPFDITQGPLLRVTLLQLDTTDYVLILVTHHLVSDAWSLSILIKELSSLYEAFSTNRPSLLSPLPLQYADFAQWQRHKLQGELLEQELDYWVKQVGHHPVTFLEIPTDRPRLGKQTTRGAREPVYIPLSLREPLKALAQQEGCTLFMALLAGLQVLFHRYTRRSDIHICTVVANRTLNDIEKLIGLFLNTLILRGELTENLTFVDVLHQARQVTLEAYDHQNVPFQKLLEVLPLPRDTQRTSLFQVLLVLQNIPTPAISLADLDCRRFIREMDFQSDMELSLTLVEADEGLTGYLEYQTDLYDASTIRRMLEHFQTLLTNAVKEPRRQIVELPLLASNERQQLLAIWNAGAPQALPTSLVQQRVAEWTRCTPDAVAVTYTDQVLTYGELNQRAIQLANILRQAGVGPEVLVGICLNRSTEMVVASLGVLKAGGAYLPLDPAHPPERLAFMLNDSGAPILLTQPELVGLFPAVTARILNLPLTEAAPAVINVPDTDVNDQNLAYAIYTSGSTGKPKGVLIQHRGLMNLVQWHQQSFGLSTTDRATQLAGWGFDASVWEIWPYLTCGASVHLPDEETRLSPTQLQVWLLAKQITIGFAPTPLAESLLALSWPNQAPLRRLLTGGDQLHDRPAPSLPFELINNYGPTENTVVATSAPVAVSDPGGRTPAIGRPIANTQIYLLDERLNPVPIGVPGELYIGGAGVARGYLQQPGLTAERFSPDPFSVEPGARLYCTGDLARYLADGQIEFLGRSDQQVKVRGFRVEPGEVESVMRQHPAIREAVVLVREDQPGNKQLIAYIVPNDEAADRTSELRSFMESRLPHYMIPTALVKLETLPLTPNGKLDRRALPAPDLDSERDDYAPPETPAQEKLSELWSEVLSVKRVGIHDNFFELGGHSLLATQLISRINRIFQLDLPMRSLFEEATIARLGALIEERLSEQQRREVSAKRSGGVIPRASRSGPLALSFAQQRLWFMDQLAPGTSAYHIPQAVRLIGAVNLSALEHSLNEIISRHEALRTTFESTGDEPFQRIVTELLLPLSLIDLATLTLPEREAQLRQIMSAEATRLFNLTHGPLLRVTLIKLTEQEHVLLVVMHHIISDGWSIGIFVREMLALYAAFRADQSASLPELPIQYADYALWQRQWLSGEMLEQQMAYWKQQFSGELPVLQLPTDHPRPPVQTFRGAKQAFAIPAQVVTGLHAVGRNSDATLFMTLLAAFQTLLYRYTGQTDLIIGTPIANRPREETEGLIGFFVNTLALRVKLDNNPTFSDLLRQVREVTLGAYAHQELPFDRLIDELHLLRDLSHAPLFQVLFVLQNAPMPAIELPDLTMLPLEMDNQAAQFDLTLSMTEQPHGLLGLVEYNTDLYEAVTIQRLIAHFQTLLANIACQPQQHLLEFKLLTELEQQLFREWNPTPAAYPQPRCLHELIEDHAHQTPDAVAVVFEDQQLTYRGLNEGADLLAHYLQQLGIGPEIAVGVCQTRSLELIISILGIGKAGGIYVPLDPTLPPARLTFALEDTQACVLLTDSHVQETLSLPTLSLKTINVDREWPTIETLPYEALKRHNDFQQVAYIIYTSGSTGQPKGVVISQSGLSNVLTEQIAAWQVTPADRVLQFASISFDASIAEIIAGLGTGATLCLAARENLLPGPTLAHLLHEHSITLVTLTPSALAVLPDEDFPALRLLQVAGEACPVELVQRWAKRCRFFNLYGPTETTIWATYTECFADETQVTIGRSIANTQAYVLDDGWQLVPIGVPGELCVGGVGLARGYLHQSELTAERFIPHPFSTEPGARLYRTGDLVRYLSDGQIEFLGRLDQQVKVRGFRIELGEIEAVLRQQPAIRDAVVVVHQTAERLDDKRLVAYLASDTTSLDLIELRRSLLARLPDYMVPTVFIMLDALPLNTSGKVDRRALPAPDRAQTVAAHTYTAPRTPVEKELAAIWIDILHLERVGIHDDFFAVGGHSLLATQVATRVTQRLQVTLPLQMLFQSPTIATLAEKIELLRWASHNQTAVNRPREIAHEEGEL